METPGRYKDTLYLQLPSSMLPFQLRHSMSKEHRCAVTPKSFLLPRDLFVAQSCAKPVHPKRVPQKPQTPTTTQLGPPVVPFHPFFGEGYPTKIDYRKKGTLILTSLLKDLDKVKLLISPHPPPSPEFCLSAGRT